MVITNGLLFCDDGVFRCLDIVAHDGVISDIGENLTCGEKDVVDAQRCYVVPGFVDIHVHGAMGADFCDAAHEATKTIAQYLLSCGVTSFLGTTMTLPEKQLLEICKAARLQVNVQHQDQAVLRGIHLEGPFICHQKRGAQNPEYIAKADISILKRLHEVSGEAVKLVAVAPETEGAVEFIEAASSICTVSIAHSSADYETACTAFSKGANHVTHLFNAMVPYSHREPGIIGAALDSDAYVELIADGVHIHPSVIRATFKLFGDDRVCLISDAMRACGLADGQYDLGGQTVTVAGKSATIESGSFAGSVTNLADCLRNAVSFGVPLEKALKAVTINPSKSVGIDKDTGSLSVGKSADILILGKDLMLKQIFHCGQTKKS